MYRRLILAILLQMLAPSAGAHDWYEGLKDSNGSPCCSGRECQPVDYRYSRATGRLEVDLDGTWMEVHPSKIVPSPSIDENVHACFDRQRYRPRFVLRCVVLPGSS